MITAWNFPYSASIFNHPNPSPPKLAWCWLFELSRGNNANGSFCSMHNGRKMPWLLCIRHLPADTPANHFQSRSEECSQGCPWANKTFLKQCNLYLQGSAESPAYTHTHTHRHTLYFCYGFFCKGDSTFWKDLLLIFLACLFCQMGSTAEAECADWVNLELECGEWLVSFYCVVSTLKCFVPDSCLANNPGYPQNFFCFGI
jgi:hypothetical protein